MLHRLRSMAHEAARFGVVGALGFLVDVGLFNLLRYAGEPGTLEQKPLTAKALSVTAATIVTYFGNRHWTWRDRVRGSRHREAVLFFTFSGLGMLIALACLGVSHYVLGLHSAVADNVSANIVGLVFGMVFRFWSYRTFVFTSAAPEQQPAPLDSVEAAASVSRRP